MRLMIVLALMAGICLFSASALGQDEEASAGPVPEWVTDSSSEVDEASTPLEVGTNADLADKLKVADEARKALSDKDDDVSTKVAWFLFLAAFANLLISIIKRVGKLTSKGKKYLPWAAMGLGVVVGFFSHYALGVGLFAAIWYGAGPPAAVIVQELLGKPSDRVIGALSKDSAA